MWLDFVQLRHNYYVLRHFGVIFSLFDWFITCRSRHVIVVRLFLMYTERFKQLTQITNASLLIHNVTYYQN